MICRKSETEGGASKGYSDKAWSPGRLTFQAWWITVRMFRSTSDRLHPCSSAVSQGSLPFQRRWKHPTTAPNLNTRRNLSSTTEDATHMIESLPWYHPRYSFHTSNRGAALFDNPFHEAILFLSGVYGKVQPHSTSHQQIPDSILQKCRFSHNLRYSFCLLLSKKVVCLYRVMPRGGLCKLYP